MSKILSIFQIYQNYFQKLKLLWVPLLYTSVIFTLSLFTMSKISWWQMSILAHDTIRKQKYRVPWYLRTRDMIGNKCIYCVCSSHKSISHRRSDFYKCLFWYIFTLVVLNSFCSLIFLKFPFAVCRYAHKNLGSWAMFKRKDIYYIEKRTTCKCFFSINKVIQMDICIQSNNLFTNIWCLHFLKFLAPPPLHTHTYVNELHCLLITNEYLIMMI